MKTLLHTVLIDAAAPVAIMEQLHRHFPEQSEHDLATTAGHISVFLQHLPLTMEGIGHYVAHPVCGRAAGFAYGEVLRYCFDEEDLLPEATWGVLGLLDDAWLLKSLHQQLSARFSFVNDEPFFQAPPPEDDLIRRLLGHPVCDALEATARSLTVVASALFMTAANGVAPSEMAVVPTLYLAEALAGRPNRV